MEKPELSKSITPTPIFEKVEKLSKTQRIIIFCGTLIAVVSIFVFIFWIPKIDKIKNLESEYKNLSGKLGTAKKTAKNLSEFKDRMVKADIQFKVIMKALPETKEIPTLLESISLCGQDSGLEFILFQPGDEINKNFYAEIPVSIQVSGRYHNLATFFDKVARLPRIVNINNFNINNDKDKKNKDLFISCTVVTYKFLDVKDSASAGKEKKKGKGRRPPRGK